MADTMMTVPFPFPGPAEVRRANAETHRYFAGDPDDGDVRCDHCDCRWGSISEGWPCGADVPRQIVLAEDQVVTLDAAVEVELWRDGSVWGIVSQHEGQLKLKGVAGLAAVLVSK